MLKVLAICLLATAAYASLYPHPAVRVIKVIEKEEAPIPYEFSFDITDEDGNKQGRQESGDASGNKKGSYNMLLADGRKRTVEYVSDGKGTRMVVRTNEPGTDEQSPVDVDMTVDTPAKVAKKVIVKEVPIKYKLIKVPIY